MLVQSETIENRSAAEVFLESLSIEERRQRLASLTDAEAQELYHNWDFWSRPNQRLPLGDWTYWLVRAGRGWGKTRVGAETVRRWARSFDIVNIIGPTSSDVRDVMIEGPSGILSICSNEERPRYIKGEGLRWPNGAKSIALSAEEPERIRGKNHKKLWCDELRAWKYSDSWTQAKLGLRLGNSPQAIVTTTPRPTALIKDLSSNLATHLTLGTTYENRSNLAPQFYSEIITEYEGTRIGRQELNAELLEDNQNALWKLQRIDELRIVVAPQLARVVVAVDPAVSSKPTSDETGIVVAGRDSQKPPHFYIIDDRSGRMTPSDWGGASVSAYRAHRADRIVGEVNNGGDLVETNMRNVDALVPYKAVHATRGKEKRAEPIAALYEQGRVHHVGTFAKLEDQMVGFDPSDDGGASPDRMDALVWALTELAETAPRGEVLTRVIIPRAVNDDRGWERVR